MTWVPRDNIRVLLEKVLARARETAVVDFDEARKRIENEQAARHMLGGIAQRCVDVAGADIKAFADTAVSDCLQTLTLGKALSGDSVQWIREVVNLHIDGLTNGLGAQIDNLKTTAGVKGHVSRLERFGLEAKRDVDIRLSQVELGLPKLALRPLGPMYHLLVTGSEHTWNGGPTTFKWDRVFEFTDDEVKQRFESLDAEAVTSLLPLPAVFAYEQSLDKAPLFGRLLAIVPRPPDVRVEYEILAVPRFLSADDMEQYCEQLGIVNRFERHRTHWSLKEIDLSKVLGSLGITLPPSSRPQIDIETHAFEVALSFPGGKRDLVRQIADGLEAADSRGG